MCGIVGFIDSQNSHLLSKMNNSIIHRGPDNEGIFESNLLSMAMRRLSIVDTKTGNQPYYSQDKSIIAIFNGEIYNHKILREELSKDGYLFERNYSDGEIIPNLYLKYGIDFVNKLNGMFAISLYDRDKNKLFLFRDRMGKKPLYYTSINNKFYFGSEIKSLLFINYDFKIDHQSLINYLQLKNTSASNTIYKEIKQLMPASYIEYSISNKSFNQKQYWNLDFSSEVDLEEVEISDKLMGLIEDSVHIRTQCDVEYGAYLSGGLDSSLVTSIISKNYNKNLKTFSLGYKDEFKNKQSDLNYARKISKELGTEHHEYILNSNEVFTNLNNVLQSFDEPFSGTISTYFLSNLISKHVKVALSGDGADELFGSYLTHRLSTPIENYLKMKNKSYSSLNKEEIELLKPFNTEEQFYFLNEIVDKDIYTWRNKLNVFNDNELLELFNEKVTPINPYSKIELSASTMLDKTLEIDQKELLANQILPFMDRLSMVHSVEVRSPFLDYRIVEYAAKIPSSLKINKNINKYILKLAAKKYLPEDLINRPKEGFVLPVYKWIEKEYYYNVKEEILESKFIQEFNFNRYYIEKLLNNFKINKQDHAKVWSLYSLAIWYNGVK